MKLIALIFLSAIVALGYDIYHGRNGIVQYEKIEAQYQQALIEEKKLTRRNEELADDIDDLRQGNRVIEELARSDLGMIKKNESFYRILDKDKPSKSSK